jgi:ligand-binding sensor domain-containing protein/two-component sensor histidine kinase
VKKYRNLRGEEVRGCWGRKGENNLHVEATLNHQSINTHSKKPHSNITKSKNRIPPSPFLPFSPSPLLSFHPFIPSLCLSLFLLFAFSVGGIVQAVDSQQDISLYIHEVWRAENGLPQNNVRAILQTQNGYIWIATEEGLARFDGIRFTVFDKQNTDAIKSNSIKVLFEDSKGNLWIGTDKGLLRWKDQQFVAYSTTEGLLSDNIESIIESKTGDLWIGTIGGLNRLSKGQITGFTTKEGLPDNSIRSIFEDQSGMLWLNTSAGLARFDGSAIKTYTSNHELPSNTIGPIYQTRNGDLWFGTSAGLVQFRQEQFTIFTTQNGLSNNKIWSIHEDRSGNLWLGTDSGLNRLKDGIFTAFTTEDGISDNTILSIYEDRQGSLWIGTPGGLTRFQGSRFTTYTTTEGLSNNVVLAILEDKEGNLWIGTEAGGLNLFKDRKFFTYTSREGLPNDMAWTVREGRDGSLWIGTQGGLCKLKDGKLSTYTTRDGLASNIVRALCEDSAGNLWIGTPAGLTKLRDGQFSTYKVEDGLSNDAIWTIHEDAEGTLWIGTLGGLTRFRQDEFTIYTTSDGLSDDSVMVIQSDSHKGLWVGTRNGGLNLLKDGKFTSYTIENGLSDNDVRAIYEDSNSNIWVGTRRGGLSRVQDGKISSITTKEGLFDDCVFQILEDDSSNLWMSCTKGVFRVNLNELNDFADGKIRIVQSISYGMADGMLSRECTGGQPAGWKSLDGKLWFPTIKGIAMLDPKNLKINQEPPPVVIERVIADDKPLKVGSKIDLSAGLGRIEFHYAGLSFLAPEKTMYKYKLEGYDKDWVDAGGSRVANYTSIPPGNYKFQVLACNNDGVWNEVGATFDFYLKPHFYQTYWFYILLAMVCAAVGLALYRYRITQVKAQFSAVLAERNRMAREIHDTLAQGFVGIGLQLQAVGKMLDTAPQSAQHHLDLAQKMVNHSLSEARRSIWNLRAQALEGVGLPVALSETAKQLTTGTSVVAEVTVSGTPHGLTSSIENNLLRIGQEALTNALKHGKPKKVDIELSYESSLVRLRITDDGCGFDTNHPASSEEGHFGLVGIRERIAGLKGELRLQSQPGAGTTIIASIPVK